MEDSNRTDIIHITKRSKNYNEHLSLFLGAYGLLVFFDVGLVGWREVGLISLATKRGAGTE